MQISSFGYTNQFFFSLMCTNVLYTYIQQQSKHIFDIINYDVNSKRYKLSKFVFKKKKLKRSHLQLTLWPKIYAKKIVYKTI